MSQRAADPIRLTVPMLGQVFRERCPSVLPSFEALKDRLSDPESKRELAHIIKLEVETEVAGGLTLYRWRGKQGVFQLEVPRPFEPNGAATTPTLAQEPPDAASQPAEDEGEQAAPGLDHEPRASVPEQTPTAKPAARTEADTPLPTRGFFVALAGLVGDSTLLMTVARTGEHGQEPVLTVTVVPQGEAFTPVCLEGTVSDLDTHFISAIQGKAQRRKDLLVQLEALEAADKDLEEAKKKEAEAKRKQADAKKKAAEKKDEKGEVEEKKADRQQEALF